jgi:hypothetical protein
MGPGRMSKNTAFISKKQPSIADNAAIQSGFYDLLTVLTLFAPRIFSIPLPPAALPLKTSCLPIIHSALVPA